MVLLSGGIIAVPPPEAPPASLARAGAGLSGAIHVVSNARFAHEVDRNSGKKLDMDLSGQFNRGVGMDDTDELVVLLCTRIGMITEDASVAALTIGSLPRSERTEALAHLRRATVAIHRLMEATMAVGT